MTQQAAHAHDRRTLGLTLAGPARRWTPWVGLVGLLGLAASLLLGLGDAERREVFFHSYLTNYTFFLSLALGGLFFVLIQHVTRAGWSVALRRIAEVVAWAVLPLSLPALVILAGMYELYEWTHPGAMAGDELLQHKQPWLNTPFFIARIVFYFLVWNLLAWFFLRRSLQQDTSAAPQITLQMERVAAPGTIFFAMTVTFAAFDLLMSLYPHWYSTIYGVYFFAGCVLGFFALVPVLVFVLQRSGSLAAVNTEHYHDMGKLMFAFVVFWAYIAFSQYMLIWYGNLPEETVFYELRQTGSWLYLSLLLLFGHFMLPFLWLLSRHPKRRRGVLVAAALWLLVMHWFDLFYLVVPGSRTTGPVFHLLDLTCFLGLGGIFLGAVLWRLGRVGLIPLGDPRLDESLGFENV